MQIRYSHFFRLGPFYLVATLILGNFMMLRAQGSGNSEGPSAEAAIQGHVEFLADDIMEGRGAGTRGHEMAARYIAAQFRQLGLKPAGDKNSYFQSVPLISGSVVPEGSVFEVHRSGKTEKFEYLNDYIVRAQFFEPETRITAPVIFVGFGIHAPELSYSDFEGVDARGKIVVLLSGAPSTFPVNARAFYSGKAKTQELANRGVAGTVTVATPVDDIRQPWAFRVNGNRFPAMRWLDDKGQPADAFSNIKASAQITRNAAERLFSGTPKTLDEVFAKAEKGEPQAFDMGLTITIATRTEQRKITSMNVIGKLEGADLALQNEAIIYSAHLDHLGIGNPINGDGIYNGAYDNAVGTAVMLEVARQLAASKERLPRSILFASVTAEEKGLLGSDYLASHPLPDGSELIANINIDMPQFHASVRQIVVRGLEHSTLKFPAEQAAQLTGFTVFPDPVPQEVVFIRSDQFSFVQQGVPAIYPSPTGGNDKVATELMENFRRNRYHKPNDDLANPFHYASAAAFARFNATVGRLVAAAEKRPEWNPGDFFGNRFAKPEKRAAQTSVPVP